MIWVRYIRKSKNPNSFCATGNAVFEKTFDTIEDIVKWTKRASKSVYIWDVSLNMKQCRVLYKKIEACIPDYESYNRAYLQYHLLH